MREDSTSLYSHVIPHVQRRDLEHCKATEIFQQFSTIGFLTWHISSNHYTNTIVHVDIRKSSISPLTRSFISEMSLHHFHFIYYDTLLLFNFALNKPVQIFAVMKGGSGLRRSAQRVEREREGERGRERERER